MAFHLDAEGKGYWKNEKESVEEPEAEELKEVKPKKTKKKSWRR